MDILQHGLAVRRERIPRCGRIKAALALSTAAASDNPVVKEVGKRAIAVAATVVVIGIAAVSVLQILGGLFFGYSFWYYVPPICTLAMLPTATIEQSASRLIVAYGLFGLLILSYVLRNWRDVEIASRESVWLVVTPHILQFTLCLAVLLVAHRRK
jgi:hypothetical protein